MLFNSPEFIFVFLPITLLIFFILGGQGYQTLARGALVIASLFFYGWWNPPYLILLISSILINYIIGSALSKQEKNHILLTLGISFNLALIGYFKYANFFIKTVNDVAGTDFNLHQIILPLAISFFTFQQIAYLVDAYRGETQEYKLLNYSLFVTFFPQLIAGPIVHHREVLPQFSSRETYQVKLENLAVGLTIFFIGLSKKVLIADGVAIYATPIFNAALNGETLTFYEAWSGALFYTFQLYFDFSGYSEMAMGAARMFGILLPLNFNSPYQAPNIIEFWRRWHITLSNFLRDYLYIPLGGNRQGEFRRNINLMITMLLGGLWHGAGWTFVFWGGLHGIYLVINNQWRSFRKFLGHNLHQVPPWQSGLGCLFTFLVVVISWVFFRAESMEAALSILTSMSGVNGLTLNSELVPIKKQLLVQLCLWVWLMPNTQQILEKFRPALQNPTTNLSPGTGLKTWLQWRPHPLIGIILGVLFFVITKQFFDAPQSEFLYFNF